VKIVVDTNIAFSAVLNTETNMGDLLMNFGRLLEFHTYHLAVTSPVRGI